jgi:hypothetical protein
VFSQSINTTLSAQVQFIAAQTDNITDKIMSQFANQIGTKLEQANKDFNLGQSNVSSAATNIINSNRTNIATTIKNSIKNSLDLSQTGNNTMTIINTGVFKAKHCTFDQSGISNLVASNIANAVMTVISEAANLNTGTNTATTETKQTNAGVDLTAVMSMIIIGVVVVCIIAVVVYFTMMKEGSAGMGALWANPVAKYGIIAAVFVVIAIVIFLVVRSITKKSDSK